jgi:uncharacterized protein (DUF1501 family)
MTLAWSRRNFLSAMGATALAGAIDGVAFAAAPAPRRRLLILVELKGGNDGLNTVVPFSDREYPALRPRLAVERDSVIRLTDREGLHPALEPLLPAWKARELAVVQGLGYPDPNLSHFRSIEIWDTASKSEEYLDEGWLARAFARSPSPRDFAADGVTRAIALANPEQFLKSARLARAAGEASNPALAHILRVEREIVASAEKLSAGHAFRTAFPAGAFGASVRTAAQLAANSAGIAVVRMSLGSFDTHANQQGVHANLLRQLGAGLAALRESLLEIGRWETTLVATYSEFGRRARENQSGGTDHGTASAHFVMGGGVRGGMHGAAPRLDRLDGNGNLGHAVDFRDYYATFLERWWGMPARDVLGGPRSPLDLLKA